MTAKHDKTIDRSLLGFADEAKRCFAFLEKLNFKCVQIESTIVRWESQKIAINVYHGRSSYEIGVTIEELNSTDCYPFPSILRLINKELGEQYKVYAAHTALNVTEGVTKLAELFNKCADTGILNDSSLFSRLKIQRAECSKMYALDVQLEQARNKAAGVWKEKNFQKFIDILAPFQNQLSSVELKKLEYAKTHVSNEHMSK